MSSGAEVFKVYQSLGGETQDPRADGDRLVVCCLSSNRDDKHTFSLFPQTGRWRCFWCDQEGQVLDLIIFVDCADTQRDASKWLSEIHYLLDKERAEKALDKSFNAKASLRIDKVTSDREAEIERTK